MDRDTLDERLRAVERTLTDGETTVAEARDGAALAERVDDLEEQVTALEDRVEELDAGLQAVRGYVGEIRSVNRDVERRADSALSTAESVADRLDERDRTLTDEGRSPRDDPTLRDDRTSQSDARRSERGREQPAVDGHGNGRVGEGPHRNRPDSESLFARIRAWL